MKTIRVLHLSTHNEECGIATFQKNIIDAMGESQAIHNEFFPISPNKLKLLEGAELDRALAQLKQQLADFDILHIQHEYSFYRNDQLQRVIDIAAGQHTKILVTLHTPPHARTEHRLTAPRGLHPRSWLNAARFKRAKQAFLKTHITPLLRADRLIVLSEASLESFAAYGVPANRMRVIEHLIPAVDHAQQSTIIADKLHKQPGDIILSAIGFLSATKGFTDALKSLRLLPENYKLAIIGGVHPASSPEYFDKLCDDMLAYGLQDRVYVTGYVDDDGVRDAMIRETDVCLYPYNKQYYDYVSSGALANAVANRVPVIAYQTRTFAEINAVQPFIELCKSPNYYELARSIMDLKRDERLAALAAYAEQFTVEKQAHRFTENYLDLVGSN